MEYLDIIKLVITFLFGTLVTTYALRVYANKGKKRWFIYDAEKGEEVSPPHTYKFATERIKLFHSSKEGCRRYSVQSERSLKRLKRKYRPRYEYVTSSGIRGRGMTYSIIRREIEESLDHGYFITKKDYKDNNSIWDIIIKSFTFVIRKIAKYIFIAMILIIKIMAVICIITAFIFISVVIAPITYLIMNEAKRPDKRTEKRSHECEGEDPEGCFEFDETHEW